MYLERKAARPDAQLQQGHSVAAAPNDALLSVQSDHQATSRWVTSDILEELLFHHQINYDSRLDRRVEEGNVVVRHVAVTDHGAGSAKRWQVTHTRAASVRRRQATHPSVQQR